MKIFNSLAEIQDNPPVAVALGNFDGMHLGHQSLIRRCVSEAGEAGLASAVFTFSNHPVNRMPGMIRIKNIMGNGEKAEILASMGVDYLFSIEFNDIIRTSPPDCFARYLLAELLKVKRAYCGEDYRFGFKGEGDPAMLAALGERFGYDVRVVDTVKIDGNTVSSTLIRREIAEGNMDAYFRYTGRNYKLNGTVVGGRKLGRRLGFPTINLSLSDAMVHPGSGVYVTRTLLDGGFYESVTNIGTNPTVGANEKNAETHLFDFEGDIYGKEVSIEFLAMLREERVFSDLQHLITQIEEDCRIAKEYHKNYKSF